MHRGLYIYNFGMGQEFPSKVAGGSVPEFTPTLGMQAGHLLPMGQEFRKKLAVV